MYGRQSRELMFNPNYNSGLMAVLEILLTLRQSACLLIFTIWIALGSNILYAQKFFPDDPIWIDEDRISVEKPQATQLSQVTDFIKGSYIHSLKEGETIAPSENVNSLGEVPDSSWFTNRIGRHLITMEEMIRGPDRLQGPDRSQPWVVVSGKSEGASPGFTILDGRGETYFIKFDPQDYPQLTTSTELIATKFFHAAGYNVPHNYLIQIRRDQLHVGPQAITIGVNGRKRPMREADIDIICQKVPKRPDGTMQALASRTLEGEPLGPFEYFGTRSDDPNDIFPHQNRRELRGLRVFSAWLNCDDSLSINSLNTYIRLSEGGYVKHHLIDFESCFGNGSITLQNPRANYEQMVGMKPSLKAGLSLGWWDRPRKHLSYPDYPSISLFGSDSFDPIKWKTKYPNPAFIRMLPVDALWATRIIMKFTDEIIGALVRTGQITNSQAEDYLVQTLIRRRDKIIRYFLPRINPLVDFKITGNPDALNLEFRSLGAEANLSNTNSYHYQWFRFNNKQQSIESIVKSQLSPQPMLAIPKDKAEFLMVLISTRSAQQKNWQKKIKIYIRNGLRKSVVGIEREL